MQISFLTAFKLYISAFSACLHHPKAAQYFEFENQSLRFETFINKLSSDILVSELNKVYELPEAHFVSNEVSFACATLSFNQYFCEQLNAFDDLQELHNYLENHKKECLSVSTKLKEGSFVEVLISEILDYTSSGSLATLSEGEDPLYSFSGCVGYGVQYLNFYTDAEVKSRRLPSYLTSLLEQSLLLDKAVNPLYKTKVFPYLFKPSEIVNRFSEVAKNYENPSLVYALTERFHQNLFTACLASKENTSSLDLTFEQFLGSFYQQDIPKGVVSLKAKKESKQELDSDMAGDYVLVVLTLHENKDFSWFKTDTESLTKKPKDLETNFPGVFRSHFQENAVSELIYTPEEPLEFEASSDNAFFQQAYKMALIVDPFPLNSLEPLLYEVNIPPSEQCSTLIAYLKLYEKNNEFEASVPTLNLVLTAFKEVYSKWENPFFEYCHQKYLYFYQKLQAVPSLKNKIAKEILSFLAELQDSIAIDVGLNKNLDKRVFQNYSGTLAPVSRRVLSEFFENNLQNLKSQHLLKINSQFESVLGYEKIAKDLEDYPQVLITNFEPLFHLLVERVLIEDGASSEALVSEILESLNSHLGPCSPEDFGFNLVFNSEDNTLSIDVFFRAEYDPNMPFEQYGLMSSIINMPSNEGRINQLIDAIYTQALLKGIYCPNANKELIASTSPFKPNPGLKPLTQQSNCKVVEVDFRSKK